MAHVDALSRAPDLPDTKPETAGFIMNVNVCSEDWVLTMQIKDEKLMDIIRILKGELKSDQYRKIKSEYVLKNCRLYYITQSGLRLVIPKAVRWRIAKYCHDDMGHYGWFPRMRKYMKEYISACV